MLYTLLAATAPAWAVAAWQFFFALLVGFVFWVLAGVVNWYLWWDTEANWAKVEKEQPKLAFFVRVMRLIGPHFRKLAKAWGAYAANEAKRRGVEAPAFDPANTILPPPPSLPSQDEKPTSPGFKKPTLDG